MFVKTISALSVVSFMSVLAGYYAIIIKYCLQDKKREKCLLSFPTSCKKAKVQVVATTVLSLTKCLFSRVMVIKYQQGFV